jgi:hypothetical protein
LYADYCCKQKQTITVSFSYVLSDLGRVSLSARILRETGGLRNVIISSARRKRKEIRIYEKRGKTRRKMKLKKKGKF